MKKSILILIVVLLSITLVGCGETELKESLTNNPISPIKTITCTKEEVDSDGYKTTDTMTITTNNDKVKKVSSTSLMEMDPEYIDFTVSFGESISTTFNKIAGMEMKYEKADKGTVKLTLNIDYDKLDPTQIKSVLGDLYDEEDASLYNSKDLTFEDFKKDSLEGYTCNK